jgi:hypothetical protein
MTVRLQLTELQTARRQGTAPVGSTLRTSLGLREFAVRDMQAGGDKEKSARASQPPTRATTTMINDTGPTRLTLMLAFHVRAPVHPAQGGVWCG